MTEKELKIRTRKFAIDTLNFVDELPNRRSANIPETKNSSSDKVAPLLQEARELTAMFTAASKTAKQNKNNTSISQFPNS